MGAFQDLTGQKFGRLTVQYIAFRKNSQIYWHCLCDCGNETDVSRVHLKNGATQSCGCIKKEKLQQKTIDLTGQRFGKLLVLKKSENKIKNRSIRWICQCDCGVVKEIDGYSLRSGATESCGCIKSKGEEKITQLLLENNIEFEKEKSFSNCRYPDTNFQAKFDFYVNNSYIIEFDGKQHFNIGGWNDDNNFSITKKHDEYKNNWCKKNKISLIRIPYTKLNTLTINDLLIESSEFLI